MGEGDTVINALIGAAVSVVLSFTAFSPILGGGIAGYLQRGSPADGIRVGALSGAISSIPFLLFFGLFSSVLFAGPFRGTPGFGFAGGFIVIILIGFVFAIAWTVGLSALGGYLGVYIATETEYGGQPPV